MSGEPAAEPRWLHVLELGSGLHLVTGAACAAVMTALVLAGRRWRGTDRERRLRRGWAFGIFAVQAVVLPVSFLPPYYSIHGSLPLHLCDVAIWLAAFGLLTGRRWLRSLSYFWGIGLCTQAFFTPAIRDGPASLVYWAFFTVHVQVVGAALYELVVLGYRPNARDLLVACASVLAYGLLVLPIDLALGVNYGFVGNVETSNPANVTDLLPAWPWRLAVLYALVVAWMALLWLAGARLPGPRQPELRDLPPGSGAPPACPPPPAAPGA